ncbi:hypothetical protein JY651_19155 [Pyxidicoccus parkwayensis]|uniref:PDZ domain-containing protein n=1 Tax=Pyxidicoccus parkwayensis TaxID=2813578 RepID=A0ABX7P8Z7_9BACT|nr:PDZ domain-containing protein [Pyxidicoccus parkwaysis]QSQ26901.1 hypothetical protein JY651_19155 [Pyxidicoccus parkwaysis]
MKRFIREYLWLLSGALILIVAPPVAAATMQWFKDFKLSRSMPALAPDPNATAIVIERERIIIPAVVTGHPTPPSPAQLAARLAASTQWGDIRSVGEHAYVVPSSDVMAAFSDVEALSKETRIVPAFRDGQARGFKLFAIRPHSLFAKLGLQNGDVLEQINGQSLTTPTSAMTAFESLRDARHVELDLERDGTPVRKTYDVL